MSWDDVQLALHRWAVAATGYPAGQIIWAGQGGGRPVSGVTPVAGAVLRLMADMPLGEDHVSQDLNPIVLADDEVESVDADENTLTLTGHAYQNADGPVRMPTTGTRPAPLVADQDLYVIVVDDDTIKLAATVKEAYNGVAIDLTDEGVGTHTIVDTPETVRVGEELIRKARGMRLAVLSVQAYAGPPPSGDLATGNNSPFARLSRMKAHSHFDSRIESLNAGGVGLSAVGDVMSFDGQLGPAVYEPRAAMEVRFFHTSEEQEFGSFAETLELTNELTETVTEIEL